jgi:hypothetical protein
MLRVAKTCDYLVSGRHDYQTLFFGNVMGDPADFTLTIRRDF